MSSNLRQPSRIAAYTAEGSYYPRELVEVNGELYLINSDGTRTRVNPAEITVLTDADGNELASIDPTVADTIELPEGTSSQSGLLKFGTTAPKANGTAAVGTAATASRSDHVHPLQTTVSGNAGTATKLKSGNTIAISGGATGTATNFDGSAPITILVTALDATKLTGIIPMACIPQGAQERLVITSTDTTRLALTSSDVQNGDVVKVESTGLMYYIKDETALGTEAAFEKFTAGTASAVAWANVTGKPSFATVATSGKYSDLSGTPTIPVASDEVGSALGTASAGTSEDFARADHVHPVQTTVSGNAGTATKLKTGVSIGLSGVTATAQSFDGSKGITIPITAVPASIVTGLATVATSGAYSDLSGTPSIPTAATATPKVASGSGAVGTGTTWARADHVHPVQTTVSGNAGTATKLATGVSIGLSGVTATAQEFDGSKAITIPVTAVPVSIVTGLATVSTSGKYSDLSGTPSIPAASTTTPAALGTAAVGTATTWARADHVHPLQTTITGNAATATSASKAEKLATPVNIGLSGVTATAQEFDGTADITIPVTAVPASIVTGLADVAKSGSYADLLNTPSIPAASTTTPKALGTAAVGTATTWARADHVHAAPTTVSGNAGSATKLSTTHTIGLSGVTATAQSFNGTQDVTIPITAVPASIVTDLATVATSGKYSDLSGTPSIPSAATTTPAALGTAAVGTATTWARADHVHAKPTTVSGNAGTATKLKTAVSIGLSGVTATAQDFDGSTAITIPVTAVPASIVTGLADIATSGSYNDLEDTPSIPVASTTAAKAAGTAAAGSSTLYARADHVHPLQTTITGNAGTATKLASGNTIALSGAATGTATNFDGSAPISIPVTALDATKLSGTIPIACIPQGALERLVIVADDTARLALTSSSIQAGDVVKVESTGLMYYVKDESALNTEAAFEAFTAGTASAVAWSNVTGKPTFATVATSGSYNDLSNKPSIPSASSTTPKVASGSGAVGTGTTWARADHVHPVQTSISGNAATADTADKVANSMIVKLNGGSTEGTNLFTYNGSVAKTIDITPSAIGASESSHTHNYAGSSSAGGAANSVANSLSIQLNSGTATTFNGSAAKSINITPSAIGAAASSHGTHVTWSTTTPKANGTASVGSASTVSRSDHVHPLQTTITGNAGSSDKLKTPRIIDGVSFDGSANAVHYAVCSTEAATVEKVITVDNFQLVEGAFVIVKFTYANSAANPTLNVSGTGAKPIYRYGTTAVSTGTTASGWIAGSVQTFVYDGTGWVREYWYNTTYSNASLGQGYATCATAAATVAKVGTLSSYTLATGGIVAVKFTYAVPASATLNINSKGAKAIYFRGAAITADVIKAGDLATFIYNGSQYHLLTIDRWQVDIDDLYSKLGSHTHNYAGSSSAGGAANSVANSLSIQLNSGTATTFNGSAAKSINITPASIGASASGHTHNYAGSSSAGGAATSANKVNTNLVVKLNGGTTEGTNLFTFNGSAAKTIDITPSAIGAAASSHTHNYASSGHTHNYAGSSSAGGAATSANKVNTNLIIKLNSGTTEGTNLFTFNGSAAKTINITPSAIGAAAASHGTHLSLGETSSTAYRGDRGATAYTHSQAAHAPSNAQKNSDITKAEIEAKLTGTITSHNHSGTYAAASHGNHVPTTETANNAKFLRNDNTWATVTPANIGAAASSHGTHVSFTTTVPKAAGTAAVGSASTVSRSDHVHPKQTISRTYTASIGTTWTGSAAPYTQTITVSGVTASDNPIVDIVLSGTYATDEAALVEYAKIYRITTAANSITVYASEKTESTVSIQLKCVNS